MEEKSEFKTDLKVGFAYTHSGISLSDSFHFMAVCIVTKNAHSKRVEN